MPSQTGTINKDNGALNRADIEICHVYGEFAIFFQFDGQLITHNLQIFNLLTVA